MLDQRRGKRVWIAVLAGCCWWGAVSHAADPRPASEAEQAIQAFKFPQGMVCELWAAEPLLANPVAFCLDEQGRVYVCETYRQQRGVEDNRNHMNWLLDDLSLTTVQQRGEMYRKFLGESANELARYEDRIQLLVDEDGDGKADRSTVFADGFKDLLDGTGAGILAVEGDVYYTCIPSLYLLRDTLGDGVADEKEILSTGYGVRVAFRGHDMHGLTLGPDGRIYFSIGDRGFNVMTREGKQLYRPGNGAVFRCERDGSELEVVAYGLRNPQELAFDDFGNLFTGDNNSDSGDQARWVQVVEGADSGWRMEFQYLSDRGPWNRERIWHPYRADEETSKFQPAYIVPPIANVADGPSGLAAYPGVGLAPEYAGHFFLVDFRGSAGNSGILTFKNEPNGATFKLVEKKRFLQGMLATDVDFGMDGRLYVSDWVEGWNGPGKGRLYTLRDPQYADTPAIQEARELMKSGFADLSADRLVELLGHPDRRIRQRAQFQLVKLNAAPALTGVLQNSETLLVRVQALWGLGQLLRAGKISPEAVIAAIKLPDPELRSQAAVILGDCGVKMAVPELIGCVRDGTAREQYLAAIALGKLKAADAVPALISLLDANDNRDPVLRHAAVMGLTGCASEAELTKLAEHASGAVRLGAVLALRRLESPSIEVFLNDGDLNVALEAARAIHDLPIQESLPKLATCFEKAGTSDAFARRVMNANFRLGKPEHALAVAEFATNSAIDPKLLEEALEELLLWDQPPLLDRVTNESRAVPPRPAGQAEQAVRRHVATLLSGEKNLSLTALKLVARYHLKEFQPQVLAVWNNSAAKPAQRREALQVLNAIEADNLVDVLKSALESKDATIRAEALSLLAKRSPDDALPRLRDAIAKGSPQEGQVAIQRLAAMNHPAAAEILLQSLDQLVDGTLAPELQLELLEAAQHHQSDSAFQQRLQALASKRNPDDLLAAHRELLFGGDSERGKAIFNTNAAASCRRCHIVNGKGGEVGPDLSGVGLHPRDYLLESLLYPDAKVAKGYETVLFALADGRVLSGIVREEDNKNVKIITPTGETIVIPKDDIDERARGKSGMPEDAVKQLTRGEVRDLVEYLSTLKKKVSGGHQHAEGHHE